MEDFYALYETATCDVPLLKEQQLLEALRALDLTKSDMLEVPLGRRKVVQNLRVFLMFFSFRFLRGFGEEFGFHLVCPVCLACF